MIYSDRTQDFIQFCFFALFSLNNALTEFIFLVKQLLREVRAKLVLKAQFANWYVGAGKHEISFIAYLSLKHFSNKNKTNKYIVEKMSFLFTLKGLFFMFQTI